MGSCLPVLKSAKALTLEFQLIAAELALQAEAVAASAFTIRMNAFAQVLQVP
jgi:hypothetical protein